MASTVADMEAALGRATAKPLAWYRPGRRVRAADGDYALTAPVGADFAPGFRPALSPGRMLEMGVFEGKYLNDCIAEFPREWYVDALRAGRLSPEAPNPKLNAFGVKSRLSLREWRTRRWILPGDPRGWFQWYCRYWLGRRLPEVDAAQIARWRSFARHAGQIRASYTRMASPPETRAQKRLHRPRQRQALLQWAHNPYI
jgi:hypothetical protein